MIAQTSCAIPGRTISARPAILIVEDELILAQDLRDTLIELGYDAFAIANSAAEAVRHAEERRPDLVMMDIRIKGPLDGIETASLLKNKYATAIIFLTAHTDVTMIERAKETEPHGYLRKPVSAVDLRTTVEIALYKHQLGQARVENAQLEKQQQTALLKMSQAAHESNERFRMMIEAVKDYAIIMLGVDGRIASWNAGAERLKGYSEQEIVGQPFDRFYTADDVAAHKPERELEAAARFGRSEEEGWRVRKDGTRFFAHVLITAAYDSLGRLQGFSKVTQDITERERAVQAQQQITEELRDNNQQLERSNRDLEDFAYIASHDLKTPLDGIKSIALWLDEDLHDLSDESRELLRLMRSRINRMEALLDDLLAFSRVGRTDTADSETNVADIFASIIEVLNPPAHIRVRVEGELPVIKTARAQLEHVLRNLINNAIKHHDKLNGEVILSAKPMGNFVEFAVRDDGPGIPSQFHERIFKIFQTLRRRDEVEGTGMGLAIVKKLVERQNCSITVHSEGNGTGTEFRFRWPKTPSRSHAEKMTNA